MGKVVNWTIYLVILTGLVSHAHSLPEGGNLKIIDFESSPEIIDNVKGLNLICYAKSNHVVYWNWFKDDEEIIKDKNREDDSNRDRQFSRIWLNSTDNLKNSYTCKAENSLHEIDRHTFTVPKNSTINTGVEKEKWVQLATFSALAILVMAIIFALICFKIMPKRTTFDSKEIRRFFGGKIKFAGGMELQEPEDYSDLEYDRSKEIKKSSLIIGRLVGNGKFGEAHAAILLGKINKGPHKQVVVKQLKKKSEKMSHQEFDSAFRNFLHKEIKLNQLVGVGNHPSIVGYIGAATVKKDLKNYKAYLVLEYCSGGNLKNYLEKYRYAAASIFQSVLKTLPKFAEQVASGLAYLGSKRVPHMDIAARNILLAHQNPALNTEQFLEPEPHDLIAKISDFGFSRRLKSGGSDYYLMKSDYLPIRWMPLEALQTRKFTIKSDCWSMGVLYWEMFTFAEPPYSWLERDEQTHCTQLIEFFQAGNTLPKPTYAPNVLWDIMKRTWNLDPNERPSPQTIKEELCVFNNAIQGPLQRADEGEQPQSLEAIPAREGHYSSICGLVGRNFY